MAESEHAHDPSMSRAQLMVRELLTERQEVFVLFNQLAGTAPYPAKSNGDGGERALMLQRFCQLLVDYVATGHFGLYEAVRNEGNCQGSTWQLAEELYPQIARTTDALLRFNDKYNCTDYCDLGDDLHTALSAAGEALASRIELEDRIVGPVCDGCEECLPG